MAEAAHGQEAAKISATALNFAELAAHGLALRPSTEADQPLQQALFVSFRADEFAMLPLPPAQKDALLHQQFRLQQHHFVTHFTGADFWVVERAQPTGVNAAIGRFYLYRANPLWHVIDIGFLPEARGQGLGSVLLKWTQASAIDAGAAAIELYVAVTNWRAEKLYRSLGFETDGGAEGFHQRMLWQAKA
jgi:GNAT superfamily N-acetyltransferase